MARFPLVRALVLVAVLATPLAAVPTGPGAYKIGGIAVDVVAGNATDARAGAYRLATRRAWPLLWARLTGSAPNTAPGLADGTIEAMVAGVEIEAEHFSPTRYVGRLAIVFDRDRASGYLGGAGGAAPPMLLLPVTIDGGASTLYQAKTPWVAAWLRFRDAASALDYVIPAASAGDNLVLTAYQTRRGDRTLWRNLLSRFKAADVLIADIRLTRAWPGGPVTATVVARHGPDATELGRATFRAANPAGVDAMLDEAVRAVDAIYLRALNAGTLTPEKGLQAELAPLLVAAPVIGVAQPAAAAAGGTEASVATADARAWSTVEADLKATSGVSGVTIVALSLGGQSRIVIRHADSDGALAYHLDARGWRLVPEAGGFVLRRRLPGEAPLPPPAPPPPDLPPDTMATEPADPLAPR